MTRERESRPSMAAEAAPESVVATRDQDTEVRPVPHLTAVEIAESRPLYLLVVKTPAERVMRRTYLSLPAAEKAVRRAQARGSAVTLELHRLVPYTVGRELHGHEAVTYAKH